jgi:hypothetical protein
MDSFVQSLGGNDNGQTAEGSSGPSVAADHLQQQQQQQQTVILMRFDMSLKKLSPF